MAAQPSPSLCDAPELQPYIVKDVEQTGKELGRGSYGVVLEVKVEGAICAAKKLHNLLVQSDNEGHQVLVQKFVKEMDLLKQLMHPRIVQYMGLAFLPGTALPLLLMERLDTSLDDTIEAKGKFPISMKQSILVDVASALLYLHGHNPPIIHRDLTAKNVLLTRAMEAKLADLGNAFLVDPSRLTQTMSKIPGTISYMPPEAFDHEPHYTSKLDTFSFGHLSLYLFTETFPGDLQQPTYYNENFEHIARSEVERRQIYVDKLTTELGRDNHPLAILVRECLHNLPDRRPTSEELHQRLTAMKFTEINDPLSPCAAMSHYDFVQTISQLQEQIPTADKVSLLPRRSSIMGIKTQKFRVLKIVDGHTLRILSSDQRNVKKEIPLRNITQVVPEKSSQKENFPFTIHFSTSEGDSKTMRYDATSEEERNEWIRLLKTPAAIYEDTQKECQEQGKTYSPQPPPLPAARTQPPHQQVYSSPHSKNPHNRVSTPGDSHSSLQQPTTVEPYEDQELYEESPYLPYFRGDSPSVPAPNPPMPRWDSHPKNERFTEPYSSESGPEDIYECLPDAEEMYEEAAVVCAKVPNTAQAFKNRPLPPIPPAASSREEDNDIVTHTKSVDNSSPCAPDPKPLQTSSNPISSDLTTDDHCKGDGRSELSQNLKESVPSAIISHLQPSKRSSSPPPEQPETDHEKIEERSEEPQIKEPGKINPSTTQPDLSQPLPTSPSELHGQSKPHNSGDENDINARVTYAKLLHATANETEPRARMPSNSSVPNDLADIRRTDEMYSSAESLSQDDNEYEDIPVENSPLHMQQQTKHPGKGKDESNVMLTSQVPPQPKPRQHQNPTLDLNPENENGAEQSRQNSAHDAAADISQMQRFGEGKESESTCRESLSQEQESDLYDVPKEPNSTNLKQLPGPEDTYDYPQVPTPEIQHQPMRRKKRKPKFKKFDSPSDSTVPKDMTDEVQGQNEYEAIPVDQLHLPLPQQTKQQEGSKDESNAVLTPPVPPQPKPRQHQNPTLDLNPENENGAEQSRQNSAHDTAADISPMQRFREGKESESTCRESLSQEQGSDLYDVPKEPNSTNLKQLPDPEDTYDYPQVPTPEIQQQQPKPKKKRKPKFTKSNSPLSEQNPVNDDLLPSDSKDMTDEVQGQNNYEDIPANRLPLPLPQQTKQQKGSKDESNAVLTSPVPLQPKPRQRQNPTPQGRPLSDDKPKVNSTSREQPLLVPTVAESLDDTSLDYDYATVSALETQLPKYTKKHPSELTPCAHDPSQCAEESQIQDGSYVSLTDKSLLVYDTPREFFSTLLKKSSNM